MRKFSPIPYLFFMGLALTACTKDGEISTEPAQILDAGMADMNIPLPPANDEFFDSETILDIDIVMDPMNWNALRFQTETLSDVLGGD